MWRDSNQSAIVGGVGGWIGECKMAGPDGWTMHYE